MTYKMTEQELNEKRLAFVDDTVAAYSPDPAKLRSVGPDGVCMYAPSHPGSLGCAIGRLMTEDQRAELKGNSNNPIVGLYLYHPELVPEELRVLGAAFLQKVQHLHDTHAYWGGVGLSTLGRKYVKEFKRQIRSHEVRLKDHARFSIYEWNNRPVA